MTTHLNTDRLPDEGREAAERFLKAPVKHVAREEMGLPPGDYGYIIEGDKACPCLVLRRGLVVSRVMRFKVFEGIAVKRVLTRSLLDLDTVNRLSAFRKNPLAVMAMTGEEAGPDAS